MRHQSESARRRAYRRWERKAAEHAYEARRHRVDLFMVGGLCLAVGVGLGWLVWGVA